MTVDAGRSNGASADLFLVEAALGAGSRRGTMVGDAASGSISSGISPNRKRNGRLALPGKLTATNPACFSAGSEGFTVTGAARLPPVNEISTAFPRCPPRGNMNSAYGYDPILRR